MNAVNKESAYCVEFFHAIAGCEEKLLAELQQLAELVKQEPGCLQYDVLVDQEDAGLFILLLKFATAELMQQHEQQEYVKRFSESTMKNLCERVYWYDANLV